MRSSLRRCCARAKYLHDVKRPDIINIQDAVALRAQPAMGLRSQDRLGKSDIQIIVLRKIWSREMRALEAKLSELKIELARESQSGGTRSAGH